MFKYVFLLILSTTIFSCKKDIELYKCVGNCKKYMIKGRIYDATTNTGFRNNPFKLTWKTFRGNCIFCPATLNDIYHGKTDANGNFLIEVNLDTTLFHDYSLVFSTPDKENYFNVFHGYINDSNLNQGELVQVPFYPKTNLNIELVRTQNDSFNILTVSHTWERVNNNGEMVFTQDYDGPMMARGKDTIVTISTAANILTKVRISKIFNGSSKNLKDSLVCVSGSKNTLRFEY